MFISTFHPKLIRMSTNGTESLQNASQYSRISYETGFIIFSVLEIIAGSLLNGFVIFVLFSNHRLLEIPANVVLLSLTISDFFACSIVLPYHLYEILHLRETLVHQALLLFAMTVGMFGIVLLTADRFVAVIWPLRYNPLVTLPRTRLVLIANWFVSFVYSLMFCLAVWYKMKGIRYFLSFVNCTAVLTMLVLYGVIFRAACRQIKTIHDQSQAARSVGSFVLRRTLKSAKTSGSVVFFFAVTFLPVCINSIFNERRQAPISFFNERSAWLFSLVYLNCSINPLLYCAFSANLRAIICKTLRLLWVGRESSPHHPRSRASSFQQSEQLASVVEMSSALSVLSVDSR